LAAVTDETGSGALVFATSPSLVTPTLGVATGTSLSVSGQLTSTVATGTAPLVVTSTTPVANLNIGGNAANVTGTVAIANGGTGSATQNFVDLTTNQTIAGIKTLSSDIVVNSVNIGRGKGAVATNTAVGTDAISATATGTDNAALGYNALKVVTSGARNTVVGSLAAASLTTGNDNSVLGYQALKNNTTGASNVAIGKDALLANLTGNNNVAIGTSSLLSNTTGFSNIAMGLDSALSNTTGNDNIAVGQSTLRLNTTGLANTAIGRSALSANTTGNYNSALGWQSLAENTTGIDNVAVGYNAGRYDASGTAMTTSSFSVYLGAKTKGLNATGSINETVIGNDAVGLGSNSTVIGNSTTTKAAIYGALDLPNNTASSSTTTGALKVGGGAGIAGAIYAGSIQNTPIGSTTASTGAFTTLAASGNTTVAGTLGVTGATTLSSTLNVTGNTVVSGTLKIAGGSPEAGKVLVSDNATGLASWSYSSGSVVVQNTTPYTIRLQDSFVFYTGGSNGAFTLPTGVTGKEITIKNKTANTITISGTSIYVDKDNTAATSVAVGNEASNNWIRLVFDGTQWVVFRALF
jgi:hypothetical protein